MPATRRKKRPSRRRLFWAWPSHLSEGVILYLDRKKYGRAMVRVRVTQESP